MARARACMTWSLVLSCLLSGAAACGTEDDEAEQERPVAAPDASAPIPDAPVPGADAGAPTTGADPSAQTGDAGRGTTAAELRIDKEVFVGAFKLTLGAARVVPDARSGGGQVVLDFVAENLTTAVVVPLANLFSEALLLELGDQYLYGSANAGHTPGLRKSTGSLSWNVANAATAARDLPQATVTLGTAAVNQVVVPFANLAATVSLADIPVAVGFTVPSIQRTTLAVKRAYVTYQNFSGNRPQPAGVAYLVLDTTLSADTDLVEVVYWKQDTTSLRRPDGVSVFNNMFEVVGAGFRKDLYFSYELRSPVAGTYTLTIANGQTPFAQTLVVP